ncbi:MAG: hypothetical protein M1318_04870 [Firmicutes bacterium]|nr:hypothetical protein [Bacillota bacterium]
MNIVVIGLLVVALLVIAGTLILTARIIKDPPLHFNWFLLHFSIGIVGIVSIVILAILHDLSAASAAIISSIVAYSLGIYSGRSASPASTLQTPAIEINPKTPIGSNVPKA